MQDVVQELAAESSTHVPHEMHDVVQELAAESSPSVPVRTHASNTFMKVKDRTSWENMWSPSQRGSFETRLH